MKKGYFFTLDAVVGIIILVMGIILVFAFNNYIPEKDNTEELTNNVQGLFSDIKVSDLCKDFSNCDCAYGNLTKLCNNNIIPNPEMTMMDLLSALYFKNRRQEIEFLINETLIDSDIFPKTHGLKIVLKDHKSGDKEQLYPLVD